MDITPEMVWTAIGTIIVSVSGALGVKRVAENKRVGSANSRHNIDYNKELAAMNQEIALVKAHIATLDKEQMEIKRQYELINASLSKIQIAVGILVGRRRDDDIDHIGES